MKNKNPIIFIDDDVDDLKLLSDATRSLGIENEIIMFSDSTLALEHFRTGVHPTPFFILCDLNMPKMDGLELRKKIHEDNSMVLRSTPFIFFSTAKMPDFINTLYTLNIQGYFTKPSTYEGLTNVLSKIISYWNVSVVPSL